MYQKAICRGSIMLGTACGRCERCDEERARIEAAMKEFQAKVDSLPPEEPEREEGWYEASFGSAGLTLAFYSEPNWYRDDDSAHEATDPLPVPIFVGPRHYLSDQYRPANTCPPPLTGELFEIYHGHAKPIEVRYSEATDSWHEPGCEDPTYAFSWIQNQVWRPLQDSQP